jgi:carbon-monoxide dehydrogenase medium subunit
MKPAPFDYVAPRTVAEAVGILADAGGGATIIAGGQTLMPLLNLRMSQPFILIDINKVEGFAGVSRVAGGTRIGPATTQADALRDEALARHLPAFVQALGAVGHHQTRNRGTIGGSIALGEPAAEMPATAVALGAMIEIASVRGVRKVAARDFYVGPYMTVLEADEMITGIVYPDWPPGHHVLFREVAQRPGDFALVGVVGALVVGSGSVVRAGLAWFGMGPTPLAMTGLEEAIVARPLDALDIDELAAAAIADTAPFDDHHASAEYRRTVGRRILARTLRETLALKETA